MKNVYTDREFREAAREQWQRDGELEIDDKAVVSRPHPDLDPSDGAGAYVAAWVWVNIEQVEVPDDPE